MNNNSNNNNSLGDLLQQERLKIVQAALAAFAPNGIQRLQPENLFSNPPTVEGEYRVYKTLKAMLDDEQVDDPWRQVPHSILSFNARRWKLNGLWWDEAGNRSACVERLPMTQFVQLRSSTHPPVGAQQQQQVSAEDPARYYRVEFIFADQSPEVLLDWKPTQTPTPPMLSYHALTMFMSVATQKRLFADLEKARLLDCPPFFEERAIVRSGKPYWAAERKVVSSFGLRLFPIRGEESEE